MDKFSEIEQAANAGAYGCNPKPLPSDAANKAGNYSKGKVRWEGLALSVEQPRNSYRCGTDASGKQWQSLMRGHYGGILGVRGADGDLMDVFIGAWPESRAVWVVNQNNKDGSFDEHKCLVCFESEEAARNAYLHSYERGWRGLGSMVRCTLDQFKWWLKNGNHKRPLTAKDLPYDGSDEMEDTVLWDSAAQPVGTDMAGVIYALRKSDADGLMLDSLTVADILEDADGELALDALVVPVAKLDRKMQQLQAIMGAASDTVEVTAMQVTPPFKQRGTTNVAAVFELSDGQTVTIYMHNPDTTPNKLAPTDELISWKWMLNKKDVTIVVAPEKGQDLNPREVGRRIMRLAERNSARFAQANKNRAERLANIEGLKAGVQAKEAELESLTKEIEVLSVKVEEKKANKAVEPVSSVAPDAKPASWVIKEKATGNVIMETFDEKKVAALNTEKYEAVPILQHLQSLNRNQDLPAGWTESSPGGMATNKDPESGGIVDKEIVSGKWFAVANKEGVGTLEGFDTRAEAFAALAASVAKPAKPADDPYAEFGKRSSAIIGGLESSGFKLDAKEGIWSNGYATISVNRTTGALGAAPSLEFVVKAPHISPWDAVKDSLDAPVEETLNKILAMAKSPTEPARAKPAYSADQIEWAKKTVSNKDYLPWADVARAHEILGIEDDDVKWAKETLAAAAAKPKTISGRSKQYEQYANDIRVAGRPENLPPRFKQRLEADEELLPGEAADLIEMVRNMNAAAEEEPIDIGPAVRGDVSNEEIYRAARREVDKQAKALGAESIDPASPEGYAKVLASEAMQVHFQDRLDSHFQGRVVETRNALRALGWEADNYSWPMAKGGYSLDADFKQVGAGRNVVGVTYVLANDAGTQGELADDLSKTPEQLAAEIDKAAPVSQPEDLKRAVAAVEEGEYQQAYTQFDWGQVKMPTAVQLGAKKLNANGSTVLRNLEDTQGWTNGNIMDVAEMPGIIKKVVSEVFGGEIGQVPKSAWERIIDKAKAEANTLVEPIANYDAEFSDTSSTEAIKKGKKTPVNAFVLANKETGLVVNIDKRYFGYFAKTYKGAEFFASGASSPILVKHRGKVVGVAMPVGSADATTLKRAMKAAETGEKVGVKAGEDDPYQQMEAKREILKKVDGAYQFAKASAGFKLWLAEETEASPYGKAYQLDQPYSPLATAAAMEEAAKKHGATIEWDFFGGTPA